ncbi:MAG: single-stranded-DNA-specific exonuclease RecJ [Peptostreptococcaceae bacterium]|nr:single-stranded-DNA-specific exonuclease RecJ [Peptostreptococcaceae bacterium]
MKKWILRERCREEALLPHLIKLRKINQAEEEVFFDPREQDLLDPFLLKDMDKAVRRIGEAMERKERIWIYGDYDVDGISAVSILLHSFRGLGVDANYYIPGRVEEGYGVNRGALDFIRSRGGDLIISVDCGITSTEEVEYAKEIGVDMIVTDHHQCKQELPAAVAVIDPKRTDCSYPNANICGAGIAFKLAQALKSKHNASYSLEELLEIAATATVADIVELSGENRTIVKLGLARLKNPSNLGLGALIRSGGLDARRLNSSHIAFALAPRINSSGRMGKANIGVELLTAKTAEQAESAAGMLELLNRRRQAVEAKIFEEALLICEAKKDRKVLVAASENWHSGVIGIVASKITERFHKPSFIIAIEEGGKGKGSGRSIEGFNLFEALCSGGEILEKFGGHEQAAGITVDESKIGLFEERINEVADEVFRDKKMEALLYLDAEAEKNEIGFSLAEDLERLEPFGIGNTRPLFLLPSVLMKNCRRIGKNEAHLKAQLDADIDVIGFHKAALFEELDLSQKVDIVFELDRNEYMGRERLQLLLRDAKASKGPLAYLQETAQAIRELKREQAQLRWERVLEAPLFDWEDYREECGLLFLCCRPESFWRITKNLYYRNMDFSTRADQKRGSCGVFLLPIIDNLDFSIYNNIILPEGGYLRKTGTQIPWEKLRLMRFLPESPAEKRIPQREDLAKLFSLISKKPQSVFDIEELCRFLKTDAFGLVSMLEVLDDLSYADYVFDDLNKNIKILYTPSNSREKQDLSAAATMKALEMLFAERE